MNEATIQRIREIKVHPNAENLELATVLGWQVVVKKGEFKPGDLCVYIAIDSLVPEKPEFEFLRNKKFKIKPIRLRGEESAGICFPASIVPGYVAITPNGDGFHFNRKNESGEIHGIHEIGDDVSDLLGVVHYEKPIPTELAGMALGGSPGFLIITDELNLRSYPDALAELYGRPYYITRKDDGSSGTFFVKGGEFGVTSRRIHLKETEGNGFWKMARKYSIENALRTSFPDMDIAVQGEVCGPSIQKNNLGLKENEFHLFNIFDITKRHYLDYDEIVKFTSSSNIPMVSLIEEGSTFGYTLEELIKLSNEQKYPTGGPAEGIVIRPKESFRSTVLKKAWSGKILNERYKE